MCPLRRTLGVLLYDYLCGWLAWLRCALGQIGGCVVAIGYLFGSYIRIWLSWPQEVACEGGCIYILLSFRFVGLDTCFGGRELWGRV